MSFDAAELVIPDFWHDYDQPFQPHSSQAVRQSDVETMLQPEWSVDL